MIWPVANQKYQRLRRWLKPLVHQFVALSTEAEAYLQQRIGVPPARLQRICNGVDVDKFAQAAISKTAPEPRPTATPEQR